MAPTFIVYTVLKGRRQILKAARSRPRRLRASKLGEAAASLQALPLSSWKKNLLIVLFVINLLHYLE